MSHASQRRVVDSYSWNQDVTRRKFVAGMLAAGVWLALPGCCRCKITHLPTPTLPDDTLLIDPHCHIFNGRDLDGFNYLASDIPHRWGTSLPVLLTITEMIRAVALTGREELALLQPLIDKRASRLRALPVGADIASVNQVEQAETQHTLEALEEATKEKRRQILDSPASTKVLRNLWEERDARKNQGAGQRPSRSKTARREVILSNFEAARRKLLEPPVFAFFDGLWFPRSVNAFRLGRVYPDVALFTPAMMDTDSWFQHRPWQPLEHATPLRLQMDLYEKIAILTDGRFLPFLAFDPRRQVESSPGPDAPLNLVAESKQRKCFVGVKLYPPMGYRPARNYEVDANRPKDWPAGLGAKMDLILETLFAECVKSDLASMAHSNRSHASDPAFLDNGKPEFWRSALELQRNLKINLGHFGGMENISTWRDGFCDLMTCYPHVYADTADFEAVTSATTRIAFFKSIEKYPVVQDRLMYGSDFFMNGLYACYERYQQDWLAAFQESFPDGAWRKLVGGNAAEYLGLPAGQQRDRLNEFVAAHQLSPRWMKLV